MLLICCAFHWHISTCTDEQNALKCDFTRYDKKKFSAPCTSGFQGITICRLIFNIISLQGNALIPSLFELSYPFKTEGLFLVPQVLVYCLYDAFIASILCTTKMGFQFWEQIKVRSHIRRIWGMGKDFKSTFSRNRHGNL